MIERLTGKNAVSASQLARETGIRQQNLSRWLEEARTLPLVTAKKPSKPRSVDEKIKILTTVAKLSGEELTAFLAREELHLAEVEQWRLALDDEGRSSRAVTNRIRRLERELARKEKALAEAAALLVLKKKLQDAFGDEDDGTDEANDK
jgi:ribonuclease P protein component